MTLTKKSEFTKPESMPNRSNPNEKDLVGLYLLQVEKHVNRLGKLPDETYRVKNIPGNDCRA
jgi:hypothetical protein